MISKTDVSEKITRKIKQIRARSDST